jgi:putative flippase GtrA
MLRYGAVGVSNVAIDVGVLTLLMRITGITSGPYLMLIAFVAGSCAIVNSYICNCRWTFGAQLNPMRQFVPFIIVQGVAAVIGGITLWTMVWALANQDVSPYVRVYEAKAVAIAFSALWNFSAMRFYVFRRIADRERTPLWRSTY